MAKERDIEEAILGALRYSNIFSYPLSFFQIGLYLGQKTSIEELQKNLKILVKKKAITKRENVYKLTKVQNVNWNQKQAQSKKLFKKYSKLLKKLEKIPWIQMIALTGSVAASNPEENDDIDIFIITKKNRLWITRFFIVVYLKAWNTYRTEQEPNGKICPNLLITENNMVWPQDKQNLYVASEIVRMQPVFDRENAYLRFLTKNKWIEKYFPNFIFEGVEKKGEFWTFLPNPLDLVEMLFYLSQRFFMKNKITTEEIKKNFIHFNKYDRTNEILEKYGE
ncbi:nucleotidyltransferase domain-containing protein [Patescibacteria group bacterium]|nr:nucleotidyltransferase domain-containing protein [Patescibacteria group bacterium]